MRKRQKREALLAAKLALLCLFVLAAAEYGTLFRDGPVDASARRSVGGQQQVDVRVDPSGMEVEVPPGMEVEFSHPMITGPGRVRIFKYVEAAATAATTPAATPPRQLRWPPRLHRALCTTLLVLLHSLPHLPTSPSLSLGTRITRSD